MHGYASGYVAGQPSDIASCIGATWIGGGVPGTVGLLRQSLRPAGVAGKMRAELDTSPARYARYQREYLGWGVFALMNR